MSPNVLLLRMCSSMRSTSAGSSSFSRMWPCDHGRVWEGVALLRCTASIAAATQRQHCAGGHLQPSRCPCTHLVLLRDHHVVILVLPALEAGSQSCPPCRHLRSNEWGGGSGGWRQRPGRRRHNGSAMLIRLCGLSCILACSRARCWVIRAAARSIVEFACWGAGWLGGGACDQPCFGTRDNRPPPSKAQGVGRGFCSHASRPPAGSCRRPPIPRGFQALHTSQVPDMPDCISSYLQHAPMPSLEAPPMLPPHRRNAAPRLRCRWLLACRRAPPAPLGLSLRLPSPVRRPHLPGAPGTGEIARRAAAWANWDA